MTDQPQANAGSPYSEAVTEPVLDGLSDRFAELAALAAQLLAVEDRLQEANRENTDLRRQLVRVRKEVVAATTSAADAAQMREVKRETSALQADVARLSEVVSEKERARFALQEEVWGLSEALSEMEEQAEAGDEPDEATARSIAAYVQEIVRLTQLLRDSESKLRTCEKELVEARSDLNLSQTEARKSAGWSGDKKALTEMRAQLTRLVCQRDHALLQGGGRR